MWQGGLQGALGITKCGRVNYKVRQGLQSMAGWIIKCVRDYKVWPSGLQSALGITKCGRVDYKVRQGL